MLSANIRKSLNQFKKSSLQKGHSQQGSQQQQPVVVCPIKCPIMTIPVPIQCFMVHNTVFSGGGGGGIYLPLPLIIISFE